MITIKNATMTSSEVVDLIARLKVNKKEKHRLVTLVREGKYREALISLLGTLTAEKPKKVLDVRECSIKKIHE